MICFVLFVFILPDSLQAFWICGLASDIDWGKFCHYFLKYCFCSFLLFLALHHTHIMPFVLVSQFWNVLSAFIHCFSPFQFFNISVSISSSSEMFSSALYSLLSHQRHSSFLLQYFCPLALLFGSFLEFIYLCMCYPSVFACFLLHYLRILIMAAFSSQYDNILAILESGFWCFLYLFKLGFLPLSMPCNFTK